MSALMHHPLAAGFAGLILGIAVGFAAGAFIVIHDMRRGAGK